MRLHESGWWIPDHMTGPGGYVARSAVCAKAAAHCTSKRVAIQAGGHIGVWPVYLAAAFDSVITVEPEPRNLEVLKKNVALFNNVKIIEGVLGSVRGKAQVNCNKTTGGHHIMTREDRPHIEVEQYTIDALAFSQTQLVDLIMLDIEGYEYPALQGAAKYIATRSPVIVIEQNKACGRYHIAYYAAQKFLEKRGYTVVDTYNEDLILARQP